MTGTEHTWRFFNLIVSEINKSTPLYLEPGVKFLDLKYDYIQISKVTKFNLMGDLLICTPGEKSANVCPHST